MVAICGIPNINITHRVPPVARGDEMAAAAALPLLLLLLHSGGGQAAEALPSPTLVFQMTMRVSEAFSISPGAGPAGDGCLVAEEQLKTGHYSAVSKVTFDGVRGRLRQSNTALQRHPANNITNIGRWDLAVPREWDLFVGGSGSVSCETEELPRVVCPNGTLPPSCPPKFGSWGALNPFTSVLGMWYPNTSKVESSSTTSDTYQFVDVTPTLLPNDGCTSPSTCTMNHCNTCMNSGVRCTKCPCEKCIMRVNVTRNYTYTLAKQPQPDGTRKVLRYQWTQGIPLTKSGASPGVGRDCFIFDYSQDWTDDVRDADFAPPAGVNCTKTLSPRERATRA